ncbi:sigma-54 dependent transcriptional regulator [Lamprobacter modestohalophilus]|uniref:sigma-54-dependent transcriptional regulator n=1 Tax=Lamprobacter modestohalophilus TaxID=1064514 RepID=UPI002ADED95F|nr:sigma-54 dependent transcriptional regulator [Lamprobacter modestohalophilus]MEA1051570.1 sigma-54 dependent transcriptional regulator [Lamprobacter modestohalophilus]
MSDSRPTVLIVDDEPLSLETMARILDERFEVRSALNAEQAERILAEDWVQVVVSDQRMPGTTGVELLAMVRERWPDVVRIIISGYTDAEDIIDGINRAGIYQYITKPWHPDNLLLTVDNACRLYQLQRENERLALENRMSAASLERRLSNQRTQVRRNFRLEAVVRGPNSPLHAICDQLARIAPYDIPVLLTGESGTGKELFARALHYNSLRAEQPFVAENCGALPDQLLESELFGHRRGAFTGAVSDRVGLFEQADGGTLFLDEIGDVSPAFQVKLLRVLQEGEIRPLGSNQRRHIDVRVVAATNRDLDQAMAEGRFRADLYYRLAGVTLRLPPLRERPGDIAPICERLLANAATAFGVARPELSDAVLAQLERYHWPGNVRELTNEIQRLLVLSGGRKTLGVADLSPGVRAATTARSSTAVRPVISATAAITAARCAMPADESADESADGPAGGPLPAERGLAESVSVDDAPADSAQADCTSAKRVSAEFAAADSATPTSVSALGALSLKDSVELLERQILSETLERCGWNKSRAAEVLGLSRVGLNNKLARYRLDRETRAT